MAGDAIYLRRTLDDTHLPYRTEDEHLFRRSLREIRQYATRDARRAIVIPGHDWEAWQRLEPSTDQLRRSLEAVMWIAPGSRTQAIRLSDCSRSSMYSNATACARLA